MYNVLTYTKFGLDRVPRTDHRRKSRTPCICLVSQKEDISAEPCREMLSAFKQTKIYAKYARLQEKFCS